MRDLILQLSKSSIYSTKPRKGRHGSDEGYAREAGIGVGTLYRHFPHRADLIAAVFRNEVDECAMAAEPSVSGIFFLRSTGAVDRALCPAHRYQTRSCQRTPFW
ncbi:TetR/AcrR family transcriptional regulator [Klebsiella variicola subsp. variicola]|nr:TetR/AcrR family transcriptional regulator [Klebsiella variicola subsp. variicola]